MKAFAYIRVSDPSQVEGDGFQRQRKAIQDYANQNGIQIQEWYQEDGVSGTLESRPALAELMVSMEQNGHGIKVMIVECLDRFARDMMVQEAIVRDLQEKGFNLISVYDGPDLAAKDPTRKMVRRMHGVINEYQKDMLVQKLKVARDRIKVRDGKCEGRKSYAESEAGRDILKRIRQLRRKLKHRKQMTYQQVADQLNQEQMYTMDGKPWTYQRVQQVLKANTRKS